MSLQEVDELGVDLRGRPVVFLVGPRLPRVDPKGRRSLSTFFRPVSLYAVLACALVGGIAVVQIVLDPALPDHVASPLWFPRPAVASAIPDASRPLTVPGLAPIGVEGPGGPPLLGVVPGPSNAAATVLAPASPVPRGDDGPRIRRATSASPSRDRNSHEDGHASSSGGPSGQSHESGNSGPGNSNADSSGSRGPAREEASGHETSGHESSDDGGGNQSERSG